MKKVFYIEKQGFLRTMLEEVAKGHDVKVYTHADVTDCHYIFNDIKPDILLIDHETALGDYEASHQILQSAKDAQIPILLTINEGQKGNESLWGANPDIVTKPIEAMALLKKILG